MRRLLALCACVALSAPALAQSQYAAGRGAFVSIASVGYSSTDRPWGEGSVGYRFSDRIDASLHAGYKTGEFRSSWAVGPTLGLTQPLGNDWVVRTEASVQLASDSRDRAQDGVTSVIASAAQDLTVTAGRRLPLTGSLWMRPSVGLYGTARQRTGGNAPADAFSELAEYAQAGVHVEFPVAFRVFSTDAAVTLAQRWRVAGEPGFTEPGEGSAYTGVGLRANL